MECEHGIFKLNQYQKLVLQTSLSIAEALSEQLEDLGALSITLQATSPEVDSLFEPPIGTTPLWEHTTLEALFPADQDISLIIPFLKTSIQSLTVLMDQDWQKQFQDNIKPQCFANKLWLIPSWHKPPESGPYIQLDPGVAFGTGSHPTTRFCLSFLAEHIQGREQVIDYGCGSGILAIGALKSGAQKAWAIDIDPQALEATLQNAIQNHITESSLEVLMPEDVPDLQVDLLVANILANPLIELAPRFAKLLKKSGQIVLSGILAEQQEQIFEAYRPYFSELQLYGHEVSEGEHWICLWGKKMQ